MEDPKTSADDTIEKVKDTVVKGDGSAREYASKGMDYVNEASEDLSEFVKRQPWVALAGAFAIGYIVARALRRLSL
jgi:hypothetical protein